MGYTRYWNRTDKKITKEFLDDCEKIIKLAESDYGIKLSRYGEDDNDKPLISEYKIIVCGDINYSCEPLVINNKAGSDFCKTREYPYDIVVNAVLKLAAKHGLVTDVSCDGPNAEDTARELLRKVITE